MDGKRGRVSEVTPGPTQLPTPTTQDPPRLLFRPSWSMLRATGWGWGILGGAMEGQTVCTGSSSGSPGCILLGGILPGGHHRSFPNLRHVHFQVQKPSLFSFKKIKSFYFIIFFFAGTLLLESARRILYGRTKLPTKIRTKQVCVRNPDFYFFCLSLVIPSSRLLPAVGFVHLSVT